MRTPIWAARLGLAIAAVAVLATVLNADRDRRDEQLKGNDAAIRDHAAKLVRDGRDIFRFDTFGSEAFWGGALRLHETIAGSANGGTGPGVSPLTAATLGLKIDAEALPSDLVNAVSRGAVRLAAELPVPITSVKSLVAAHCTLLEGIGYTVTQPEFVYSRTSCGTPERQFRSAPSTAKPNDTSLTRRRS